MNAEWLGLTVLLIFAGVFLWVIAGAAEETRKDKGGKP